MGGEVTDKEVTLHHPNGTIYHFPAGTPTSVIEEQKAKLAPKPDPSWLSKAWDWSGKTLFPESFEKMRQGQNEYERVLAMSPEGREAAGHGWLNRLGEENVQTGLKHNAIARGVLNTAEVGTSPQTLAAIPALWALGLAGLPGAVSQLGVGLGMVKSAYDKWRMADQPNVPAGERTTKRTEAVLDAAMAALLAKHVTKLVRDIPPLRTTIMSDVINPRSWELPSIREIVGERPYRTARSLRPKDWDRFAKAKPVFQGLPPAPVGAAEVFTQSTPPATPTPVETLTGGPAKEYVPQKSQWQIDQAAERAAQIERINRQRQGVAPRGPAPGGWDTTPLDQIPEGALGLTGKVPGNVEGKFTPQVAGAPTPPVEKPVGALQLTGEAGPATPLPATPVSIPKPVGEQPVGSLGLRGVAGETKPLPPVPETGLSKLDVKAFEEKYPGFKKANPEVELEPEMVPVLEEAVDGRIGDMVSLFESGIGELSGKGIPISAEEWMRLPIETTANMKTGYGAVKVKMGFPELANIKGSPSDILKAIRRDKNNKKYLEIRDAALKAVMQAPEMKGEMQTKNAALKDIKGSGGDSEAVRLLLREGWDPEDVKMNIEERRGLRGDWEGQEGFADIRQFRHKGRNAEDLKLAAVSALRRNDLLGFDTAGEALAAIRDHADWANRWEVTPSDHAVLQAWRELRMQEPMPTDIWRDVIQPSARALRKEMIEDNAIKARKKFSVVRKPGEEGYTSIERQKAGYIGPSGEVFPLREGAIHTPQTGSEYGATYRYWPPFEEGASGTLAVNFRGVPNRTVIDAVQELLSDTGADLNWEITQNNRTTHYGMNLRGLMRDLAKMRGEEGFADTGIRPTDKELEKSRESVRESLKQRRIDKFFKQQEANKNAVEESRKRREARLRGEEGSIDLSQLSYKEKVEKLVGLAKIETRLRSELATQTLTREEKFAKENLLQSIVSQQTKLRRITSEAKGEEGFADILGGMSKEDFYDYGYEKLRLLDSDSKLYVPTSVLLDDSLVSTRRGPGARTRTTAIRDRSYLSDLKADIKKRGLQKPIAIDLDADGTIHIIDGTHRLMLAQELGLKTVRVELVPHAIERGAAYEFVKKYGKSGEEGFADISKKDQKVLDFTPVDVPGQQKGQAAEDLFQQILNAKDSSVSKRELLGLNKKKKASKEPPKDSLFAPRTMFKD